MIRGTAAAGVLLMLAAATTALAQGKSQQNKAAPPSRDGLTAAPAAATSVTPLAWVDDASLLPPGTVAFSVSAMRWQGAGVSEVDAPIVNVSFGLARQVQLSASIPRIVGSGDPAGAAGGVGTSFFSAKIALYEAPRHAFKIAAAPTLQLLSAGILEQQSTSASRVRWGLPLSAEASRGTMRLYGGGGYFSPGIWFGGAAAGLAVNAKTYASVGVSRAWRTTDLLDLPMSEHDRKELSGGVSYALRPGISAFGSIGRTFATLDQNGAGTAISGGLSMVFTPAASRP